MERHRRAGGAGESPDFAVLRCVDWLQDRGEAVNQELWDGIYEIATTAKRPSVRLKARQMIADRVDPIPKAPALEVHTGPVILSWQTSESPTSPAPSKPPSTNGSNGHVLELPSSSVTDALENL